VLEKLKTKRSRPLLARLLHYHRRDDRPACWQYFDTTKIRQALRREAATRPLARGVSPEKARSNQ
jgi:hypothetical protein